MERERSWRREKEKEKLIETEAENNYVNACWVRVRIKGKKQEKRIFEKGW